ncbi:MAG TPA: isocitrate lyase/phosphoenolpyruvate mutase family protein [Solirubrobacteraceae bacterium]|jgi:2-methylisocitrate lyase-like PEP mutase family enzyme|nr:isocitrate lyase/phosphoenolpyruvate mutase family protein [Solirubrobacteraceae bacterium]
MSGNPENAARFLELHHGDRPLLMPNAWDAGSARLLESIGFRAIATTSSGFAATLGRLDYAVTRQEALEHAAALAAAVEIPVSADLEDCFATDAAGVSETVRGAVAAGLAGCSIEDWSPREGVLLGIAEAAERVAAAAEAAHGGETRLVLTARAENHLRGVTDLGDTIARLQAYQEAGADALFAPGADSAAEIRELVASVELPVSVLARGGTPAVAELRTLGVSRVSVGGSFAFAALAAAAGAARELFEQGTYSYLQDTDRGVREARAAFAR